MNLVPRSLFGRNVLLIVLLMAVAQLGSALLVRELILRPRLEQIGDGLARNIAGVRAGLAALEVPQRAAFIDEFNRRALAGARAAPETPRVPGLTPLERRFVRSISQRVAPEGSEIVWRREAGGSLAVSLSLDGTPYWFVLPGVLPAREFTGAFLAASFGAALLALFGAFVIQRHLNRPLARVVAAAGELANGATPPPLTERGPTETAALARSFNQLARSLERTERERALMLAGVSHDLRTPLAKLRLAVEIVRDRIEPELATGMTRSVDEMDAIVGQFLDFARSAEHESATIGELNALARDVAAAFADHAQPIALELGADTRLRFRPQALRRAVMNLAENAFRHGRAPVVLRTGREGGWAWIAVVDAGPGIRADQIDALRQPFRRAADARNGPAGAGLGLAIAERVAHEHGGRLDLEPARPHGWMARLRLPRER